MYQLEDEPPQRRRARALSDPGPVVRPVPRARANSVQGAQFDYGNLPPLRNPAPQQAPVIDQQPPVIDQQPPVIDQQPPVIDQQQPPVIDQQQPPVIDQQQPDVDDRQPAVVNDQLLPRARGGIQAQDDIADVPVVNERTRLVPRRARANSLDGYVPLPPGHSQNQHGSTLGTNVADFVTANTPGQLTGASGFGGTATNIMGGNGSPVPSSLVNPGAISKASLGFSGATGLADVVGIGRNIAQIHRARMAKNAAPLGPTGSLARSEGRSAIKRGAVDLATNAVDLTGQTTSAVSTGLGIAGKAAPTALGLTGAIGGIAVNTVVGARNAWRGGRALMHERRVATARQEPVVTGASPDVRAAAKHHETQMNSRKWRAGAGVLGAGLGIAGGIAALALGLSNPIGWGLLAAGGLVAAGLGAYKLGRWAWKKHKGTLGEDRHTHATTLVNAVRNNQPGHADHDGAERVLSARGINVAKLKAGSHQDALDHVKRKAEGW